MAAEELDEKEARSAFRSAHMNIGLASPGASIVLHALLVRAGSTVDREQLGVLLSLSQSTVSSYICQLRLELQRLQLPEALETIYRQGYRIKQSAASEIVQKLHLNEVEFSRLDNTSLKNSDVKIISVIARSLPKNISTIRF